MFAILKYELEKILEQERERIFLWFPVVFALGIATYFTINFEPSIWWSLAIIELMIILAYIWRTNITRLSILGWFAVFVLGFVNIQVRAYHLSKIPLLQKEKTLYLKGYVDTKGYNYHEDRIELLEDSFETLEELVNSVVKGFDSAQNVTSKIVLDEEKNLKVFVTLSVKESAVIKELSNNLQAKIKTAIKKTSDLEVKEVNISIKELQTKEIQGLEQ